MSGFGFTRATRALSFTSLLLTVTVGSSCRSFPSDDLVVRPEPAPEPLIVRPAPAPTADAVTTARPRQQPPIIYIDGVRIEGEERRELMMGTLDPSSIERIETFTGPRVAERFPDDSEAQARGVIMIYTKRAPARD